jgi:outer membrane biosynthesis protein TonB
LVIALAASLVLGPPPVDASTTDAPALGEVAPESSATPLPDVDDPPGEVEPEVAPEQAPEAEPAAEEQAAEPPPPSVTEPPDAPVPAPTVERDRLGCDGSPSCQRMTIVGIVVGTLGLAAVGTGIGLLVNEDEVIPESPTFVTSTRPAGVVTVTIGAGVTLTAVLMLVASHRGYKQRKAQARIAPAANGLGLRF